MLARPFRRSVVLLLLLTLVCLVPASAAAAGPRDPGDRYARAAEAQRPVTGFWTLVLTVVERAMAVIAPATGDSVPAPVTPTSGAGLDPSGIR
jgi:hypothetical protein